MFLTIIFTLFMKVNSLDISWSHYIKMYDDIRLNDKSYMFFKKSLEVSTVINQFLHVSNNEFSRRFIEKGISKVKYVYNGFANGIMNDDYFSWYEKGLINDSVNSHCSYCHVFNSYYDFRGVKNINYKYDIYEGPLIIELHLNPYHIQYYNPNTIYDNHLGNTNYYGLIVGYGKENNILYWIVQLSLGKNWGNDGLMKIKIDSECINAVY